MKKKNTPIRTVAQAVPLVASLIGVTGYADEAQAQAAPATDGLAGDGSVRADMAAKPSPVGQSASEYRPPATKSMKGLDTIQVPSPYVAPSNHEGYVALEAKGTGDVSKALNTLGLSSDQRMLVRNYMGQYDHETQVVATGFFNGVQTFGIKDRKSGDWVGSIMLRPAADGAVEVDKVFGAEFEYKHTVDLPVPGTINPEAAKSLLGNSREYGNLVRDAHDSALEIKLPLIKAKAGMDYGLARQSTAIFNSDGTGHEYGLVTKVGSATAEGGLSSQGVSVGVGVKGPEVEGYVNYFGRPSVDSEGNLTHSVYGARVEMHGTMAEVEAKATCTEDKGCGVGASLGALGIGIGGGLTFSTGTKVAVESVAEIEPGGPQAAANSVREAAPLPAAASAEEIAFHAAAASGTPEALAQFGEQYPASEHSDEVSNLVEKGAAGEAPEPVAELAPTSAEAAEPNAVDASTPGEVEAAPATETVDASTPGDVEAAPATETVDASTPGEVEAAPTTETVDASTPGEVEAAPATETVDSSTPGEVEAAAATETGTAVDPAESNPPTAAEAGDTETAQERSDYQAATADGSVAALQSFLDEYPNSSHDDDVKKLEESAPKPDDTSDGQKGKSIY